MSAATTHEPGFHGLVHDGLGRHIGYYTVVYRFGPLTKIYFDLTGRILGSASQVLSIAGSDPRWVVRENGVVRGYEREVQIAPGVTETRWYDALGHRTDRPPGVFPNAVVLEGVS